MIRYYFRAARAGVRCRQQTIVMATLSRYEQFVSPLASERPQPFSSNTISNEQQGDNDTTVSSPKSMTKTRKRHSFGTLNMDEIPTFETFQQQQQVRALYRQFMRLIYSMDEGGGSSGKDGDVGTRSSSSRDELLQQVRRQFRQNNTDTAMSSWDTKRAISEGNRRYKEVSAMLGNVIQSSSNAAGRRKYHRSTPLGDNMQATNSTGFDPNAPSGPPPKDAWPWANANPNTLPERPKPFPKKSGL